MPATYDLALVLEHFQGVSLDLMAGPPPHGLDTWQRCKIMRNFCCALVYLYLQAPQLVFGDIKDTNALVEQTLMGAFNVKLLDSGLGRVLARRAKPLGGTLL